MVATSVGPVINPLPYLTATQVQIRYKVSLTEAVWLGHEVALIRAFPLAEA